MTEPCVTETPSKIHNYLIVLAVVLLILFAFYFECVLEFIPDWEDKIWGIVASLFFITVLLERSVEVIISTWRGPDTLALENKMKRETEGSTAYVEAEEVFNRYKKHTTRYALWSAFFLGLLVSAAGVRALEPLIANCGNLKDHQRILFRFVDLILTGGLIAGGSDAFHQMIQVYTNFMTATSNKIKASKLIT